MFRAILQALKCGFPCLVETEPAEKFFNGHPFFSGLLQNSQVDIAIRNCNFQKSLIVSAYASNGFIMVARLAGAGEYFQVEVLILVRNETGVGGRVGR